MSTATSQVRRVILGTAGHIDHGKTSLVSRLTGTWTDTLPEEQERGMTIDVGYAAFTMPDGTEVGLLDVPGHERLVRTMVAAATAMDLALLVVAADDGPMPQTREHIEILDVLGVKHLVVALTKCDLVDEETILMAEEEVREMLAPTGMAGAPIVQVSSETGAGFDDLRAAIATVMPPASEYADDPFAFRMPVLRRFHVPGLGAVMTGIPISGRIAVGDRVDVLPRDWTGKVRAIQVHHRDAEHASRGHRAALALSDVPMAKVKRGMILAAAGVLRPVHRLAARVRVLAGARKPLAHADRARLHVGADQAVVKIHLPARTPIGPGEFGLVELESTTPLCVAPGDRLVLRAENASGT
ncbi:MAG: selenocysteine-specific translation elongation factor, partial [Planctomycetota bacterium]|nr:selenocysteine-specific translation elongation factor [Planctomycetota bacterium]